MKKKNLWHPMTEEPPSGCLVYDNSNNVIFDASPLIGSWKDGRGRLSIGKLDCNASNFTCWCDRGTLFKETGLSDWLTEHKIR